ncbi:hypothetical protein TNCV_1649541 [Trichonephila clavipes]|nr:hypothetical protein TNCV_1649541 [Trichonephila clavipes]
MTSCEGEAPKPVVIAAEFFNRICPFGPVRNGRHVSTTVETRILDGIYTGSPVEMSRQSRNLLWRRVMAKRVGVGGASISSVRVVCEIS